MMRLLTSIKITFDGGWIWQSLKIRLSLAKKDYMSQETYLIYIFLVCNQKIFLSLNVS